MKKKEVTNRLYKKEGIFLSSAEEMSALGKEIGLTLSKGAVLALSGDLGAGKTTFVKGVAAGLGVNDSYTINSPTFNYMNVYEGRFSLYHFDLYRLRSSEEFFELGFVEFLSEGVSCIEWPKIALPFLPSDTLFISIAHDSPESRKVFVSRESQ